MPRINPTVDDIIALLSETEIALIGNSERLFETEHQIDRFERVVRINNGHLAGRRHPVAGVRTDVLALSLAIDTRDPSFTDVGAVLWMTPKRESITSELAPFLAYYPQSEWDQLFQQLGARPSTGCMIFDFIVRNVPFSSVTLIGFDFWRSATWYTGEVRPGPHQPGREETHFRTYIDRYPDRIKLLS